MLLDEDPAALIHECIGNFNIAPDRAALSRISESLQTLHQARELRLHEAEAGLKKLSRTFNSLSQQHNLNISSHNPTDYASSILALDTQKFKVAKEASDLEIEGERLEQELLSLEGQLNDLEAQGPTGRAEMKGRETLEDQAILKLKLFRSLGIDLEADSTGRYSKAIVRNMRKGVAQVVNIDPKYSRLYYANRFWEAM